MAKLMRFDSKAKKMNFIEFDGYCVDCAKKGEKVEASEAIHHYNYRFGYEVIINPYCQSHYQIHRSRNAKSASATKKRQQKLFDKIGAEEFMETQRGKPYYAYTLLKNHVCINCGSITDYVGKDKGLLLSRDKSLHYIRFCNTCANDRYRRLEEERREYNRRFHHWDPEASRLHYEDMVRRGLCPACGSSNVSHGHVICDDCRYTKASMMRNSYTPYISKERLNNIEVGNYFNALPKKLPTLTKNSRLVSEISTDSRGLKVLHLASGYDIRIENEYRKNGNSVYNYAVYKRSKDANPNM